MSNPEEETYSIIYRSLKHPLRRKILRMLSEGPRSFSEMQEDFRIESSHMTYHLESLGSLLKKVEDGKYALSSLGEAAVSMMNHVEEPPKTALQTRLPSKRWKVVLAISMLGLVLLSCLCYVQYHTLTQLSAQFLNLKEERELVEDVLREALGLENAVYTYEHAKNGTLTPPLFWEKICSIYSLLGNSTLKIRISFPPPDHPNASLYALLVHSPRARLLNDSVTSNGIIGGSFVYDVFRAISIANNGTYSAILPSRGWYEIEMVAADVWDETEDYTTNYTIALQIKDQKNYIPFFVENHVYSDP